MESCCEYGVSLGDGSTLVRSRPVSERDENHHGRRHGREEPGPESHWSAAAVDGPDPDSDIGHENVDGKRDVHESLFRLEREWERRYASVFLLFRQAYRVKTAVDTEVASLNSGPIV